MTSNYKIELTRAMTMLAEDPRTVFVGQSVRYPGTSMYDTFADVPDDKKIEMPVAEEMQLGICNGLALAGKLPICCFPRMNFMLLAMNQLVNHLDKMPIRVIIRVGVGSDKPLDPGPQHVGNYIGELQTMCPSINFIGVVKSPMECYQAALRNTNSTMLVEYMELY